MQRSEIIAVAIDAQDWGYDSIRAFTIRHASSQARLHGRAVAAAFNASCIKDTAVAADFGNLGGTIRSQLPSRG